MNISSVVLTKNSSQTIEKCLGSLKWCNETLVIDDASSDNTVDMAKKMGAKVFSHALDNNFSQQRNFGLEKATGDWILFVDSDEIISSLLKEEIELRIKNNELSIQGFYVKRVDTMWGRELQHGEAGGVWLLRLAKKNIGKWKGKVHEVWDVKGDTGRLKNPLQHFPHPTINEFLTKINIYSMLRAEELYKENVHASWIDIIAYPKAKFFLNYIVKQGFFDGIPGFLIAIVMCMHSFLVRGKLWQLQNTHQ